MDAVPLTPQMPLAVQELIDYIHLVIAQTRILMSVTCGVYVWEWLTNLSAEYTLVWKKKMGFLNITFLLLRYYTFLALGLLMWVAFWEGDDMKQCQRLILMLPYVPLPLFVLANFIVIARAYAMWDKDKRILAFLSALCCAQIIVQAYIVRKLKPMQFPMGIKACGPAVDKHAYLVYGVMIVVFDFTILALSLIKLAMHWKANGYMSNLVWVLFRDQVMFYMLTFTVNVTNIIVFYADQKYGAGKDFLAPVSAGITSMAICRVFLNLRREATKETSFIGSGGRSGKSAQAPHQLSGAINIPTFPPPPFSNYATSHAGQGIQVRKDVEKQDEGDHLAEGQRDVDLDYQMHSVPKI